MPDKPSAKVVDLVPEIFPKELDWANSKESESLEKVFEFVNGECAQAIAWYYSKKRPKRILGYWLRAAAILSVAIAGAIPILGEIFDDAEGPISSPAWAAVALALAALFITFDRFGGYTSSWVRFVRTAQALTTVQSTFRIEWEKLRAAGSSGEGSAADTSARLQLCQGFLTRVNSIIQAETDEWAREFQSALSELDKKAKDDEQQK